MSLIDMVPECFRQGPEMAEIQRIAGVFIDRLEADIDDVFAQFCVETATWGLAELWEPRLGIKTDLTKSLDLRRSQVKAKLQGMSTTTPAAIKAIAERWTGGVATVEEHPSEYWFKVIIDGLLNQPEDLDGLKAAVAEIKPAHLGQEYALQYQSGRLSVACAMAVQQVRHYHYSLEGST